MFLKRPLTLSPVLAEVSKNSTFSYCCARCSPSSVVTSLVSSDAPLVAHVGLVTNKGNNYLVSALRTHVLNPLGSVLEGVAICVSPTR